MGTEHVQGAGNPFALTRRQKRLRLLSVIDLILIGLMFWLAATQPFFHPVHGQALSESARKAIAVQGLLILSYYAAMFILANLLLLLAWLYVREVRLQLALARRDIWRDVANKSAVSPANSDSQSTQN